VKLQIFISVQFFSSFVRMSDQANALHFSRFLLCVYQVVLFNMKLQILRGDLGLPFFPGTHTHTNRERAMEREREGERERDTQFAW